MPHHHFGEALLRKSQENLSKELYSLILQSSMKISSGQALFRLYRSHRLDSYMTYKETIQLHFVKSTGGSDEVFHTCFSLRWSFLESHPTAG